MQRRPTHISPLHTYRCLATTVNSLARLRSNVAPYSLPLPPALLPALTTQAQRAFRVAQPSKSVNSGADGGSKRRGEEQERFTPQGLSNVINGFARLGHTPPRRFLDAFCEEALLIAPEMGPQTLANVMNALGKLNHHPGHRFLEAMASRGQHILEHFNTQVCVCRLGEGGSGRVGGWGLAAVRVCVRACVFAYFGGLNTLLHPHHPTTLPTRSPHPYHTTTTPNQQGLANLLNGFARLNPPFHPGPEFLERFKQVSFPDLYHFESRGLAALAHG